MRGVAVVVVDDDPPGMEGGRGFGGGAPADPVGSCSRNGTAVSITIDDSI